MDRRSTRARLGLVLLSVLVWGPCSFGQEAAKPKAPAWFAQLSPAEQKAVRGVVQIAFIEERCRELLGTYVQLEKLVEGCRAGATITKLPESFDPRNDPSYEFHVDAHANTFDLTAAPKRPGGARFTCNGRNVYAKAGATASTQQESAPAVMVSLQELVPALGLEAPATPRRPRVWTEEDLAGLKGGISVVGGERSSDDASGEKPASRAAPARAAAGAGSDMQFSTAEACATEVINNIIGFEFLFCESKMCTLEELEKKVAEDTRRRGTPLPAGWSLRQDDNYQYAITANGARFDVAATPRRAGLGGFYCSSAGPGGYLTGQRCFYNPRGDATPGDTAVSESSVSGLGCVRGNAAR